MSLKETVGIATTTLILVLLGGCGTFETVLDVDSKLGKTTIESYHLAQYQESIHLFNPVALTEKASMRKLERRANNLLVLISPKKSSTYRGIPSEIYTREIFRRFNRSVPRVPLSGGFWQVGLGAQSRSSANSTLSVLPYQPLAIENNLDTGSQLPTTGRASLSGSIDFMSDLLSGLKGVTALLVIAEWEEIDQEVHNSIRRFRQRGDSIAGFKVVPSTEGWSSSAGNTCVFGIGIGNRRGSSLLKEVDSCGSTVNSDQVMQPREMSYFVEKILFSGPADSDGDGIYDYLDECPSTTPGRVIGRNGCARFTRGDDE